MQVIQFDLPEKRLSPHQSGCCFVLNMAEYVSTGATNSVSNCYVTQDISHFLYLMGYNGSWLNSLVTLYIRSLEVHQAKNCNTVLRDNVEIYYIRDVVEIKQIFITIDVAGSCDWRSHYVHQFQNQYIVHVHDLWPISNLAQLPCIFTASLEEEKNRSALVSFGVLCWLLHWCHFLCWCDQAVWHGNLPVLQASCLV